jgi:hypothetical protein
VLPSNRAFFGLAFAILILSSGVLIAQTAQKSQESSKPNPQARVTAQQSVVVEAHLTHRTVAFAFGSLPRTPYLAAFYSMFV